eukprot:scaffold16723_cov143-Isochrysis_galbana.AAC.8
MPHAGPRSGAPRVDACREMVTAPLDIACRITPGPVLPSRSLAQIKLPIFSSPCAPRLNHLPPSCSLAHAQVETYLKKRRSSQHSHGSRRSAVSLTYERGSTRCASTDSIRRASQSSFDQPEGGFTPTTQRPPLVTEEDGHLQAAPEACGDPEADCEGGDERDACGQCEDRGGEGAGPSTAEPGASVAAVEPPSDGDEPEECCLCMEAFAEDALVS